MYSPAGSTNGITITWIEKHPMDRTHPTDEERMEKYRADALGELEYEAREKEINQQQESEEDNGED